MPPIPDPDDWQPIDTAPKNGRRIFLSDAANDDTYEGRWCVTPSGGRWLAFYAPDMDATPTHWKPLDTPYTGDTFAANRP